jgi:hypothetical protein
MEIKIESKTVLSNEGGFEPHPESYTPRVFAAVWERGAKVYEILQNGQAIPWPFLPYLEGFDYWVLYVEHLSDVDMHRAPKPKVQKFWAGTNVPYSEPRPAFLHPDPVPQADGDCPNPDVCGGVRELVPAPVIPPEVWAALKEAEEHTERESGTLPEDVTWVGEIDGKRYAGLNRAKPGPCPECHAPYKPAPTGADILGEHIRAAGCLLAQSEATAGKIEESGNLDHLPEGSH